MREQENDTNTTTTTTTTTSTSDLANKKRGNKRKREKEDKEDSEDSEYEDNHYVGVNTRSSGTKKPKTTTKKDPKKDPKKGDTKTENPLIIFLTFPDGTQIKYTEQMTLTYDNLFIYALCNDYFNDGAISDNVNLTINSEIITAKNWDKTKEAAKKLKQPCCNIDVEVIV